MGMKSRGNWAGACIKNCENRGTHCQDCFSHNGRMTEYQPGRFVICKDCGKSFKEKIVPVHKCTGGGWAN